MKTLEERFAEKAAPANRGGCRLWTGWKDRKGYGMIRANGRRVFTHRVVWELAHGPIPEGLCVLHRCDVPGCVAVDHLFLGTNLDNMKDKMAKGRHHYQKKTHCPRGHPLSGANLYRHPNGSRRCRICGRYRQTALPEKEERRLDTSPSPD